MPTLDKPAFDAATFEAHLAEWADLPWLQEIKRSNWEAFEKLPMPSRKDERWRFSGLHRNGFDLAQFRPASAPETEQKEILLERSKLVEKPAGRLVFADNHLIAFDPASQELIDKGVIWMPLSQAFKEHPELVRKYFLEEEQKLGSDKLLALHNAFFQDGAFLYVPKGVEVKDPFIAYYWSSDCEETVLPHTLLVTEDNSKVDFMDYYGSGKEAACCPSLSIATGTIHAGAGSQVFRKIVQNLSPTAQSFQVEANAADRDAQVKTIAVNLGAKYARLENQTRVAGSGADVKMYSLTVATGDQEFDQRTLQTHIGDHATSDLLYKNALMDDARTIFSGMILVEPTGQQTDAYQTNRNLLLSPTAEACSLPGLEIEANDVKCSHGATTGEIDSAQLYYLMARGIPKKTAEQLLVFGFFEEIIEKIDNEELKDNLRNLVQSKFQDIL
ncbi:Fe-S cluster assembly protein SufD [Ruficoccus sp. ZRK36]|uniref:Fe-S cluster assembly protein SufD n=1 Tax=Ruficoccus sp. ZRK36 TaxID=2866311 RepID=UPI001C73D349|nr:Fe-S cluster assembly protein SufD [Ruficoccus sp. ZRK36]QYY35730.1 Fe-S cluster assembly protein SufD [Ruficoccus sp. ZRK36]